MFYLQKTTSDLSTIIDRNNCLKNIRCKEDHLHQRWDGRSQNNYTISVEISLRLTCSGSSLWQLAPQFFMIRFLAYSTKLKVKIKNKSWKPNISVLLLSFKNPDQRPRTDWVLELIGARKKRQSVKGIICNQSRLKRKTRIQFLYQQVA